MATNKRALASAAVLAAGLAIGGAAVANAAANGTITATLPGATTTATPGDGSSAGPGSGRHTHTAVTGDELTKVTAAVTAKDSAVTVTRVQKDPDGSYDVLGTKDGATVCFEVSADLATITQRPGGPGMGGMGGGMGDHTVVTGDEATKVGNAVKAKDSAVVVQGVMKDEDGSYDVMGTKDGARVRYEVSADLATVTQATAGGRGGFGGPGHRHGMGWGADGQTPGGQGGQTQAPSAAPSSAA